jgi:hypothetical protein
MVITIGLSRRAAVRPVEERRFDLARGGGLCPTLPPLQRRRCAKTFLLPSGRCGWATRAEIRREPEHS